VTRRGARRSLAACALALVASAAQARAPQMAAEGAVQYFCGGVGPDERRARNCAC